MSNVQYPIVQYPIVQRSAFIILLCCLAVLALYWWLSAGKGPFRAIPEQSALMLECKGLLKARQLAENIPAPEWKSLANTRLVQQCFEDADGMFQWLKPQPALLRSLAQSHAAVAFSLHPSDSLHPVFIIEMPEASEVASLLLAQSKRELWPEHQFHTHTVVDIQSGKHQCLSVAVADGLLIFSRQTSLVEAALAQLDGGGDWWTSRPLTDELALAPLRMHLRPSALAEQLRSRLHPDARKLPDQLAACVEWAGVAWDGARLDMLLEPRGPLAELKAWGQSLDSGADELLPDQVALLLKAGLRAPKRLFEQNTNREFEQYLLPWMGKEAALAFLEPGSASRLLLVAVGDSARTVQALHDYGAEYGLLPANSGPYRMFELMGFRQGVFLEPILGKEAAFPNPVAAMVADYVVFAPDRASMEVFLDKYLVGQSLGAQEDYLLLQQQEHPGGAIDLLLDTRRLDVLLQQLGDFDLLPGLLQAGWLKVSLQPESSSMVRVSWAYQPHARQTHSVELLWKTPLGNTPLGQPRALTLSEGKKVVLVQDGKRRLHCLDALSGRALWSRDLPEAIVSDIVAADYYQSGEPCLIFSTASACYLLDGHGRDVHGYPFPWPGKATGGVTVVDFEHDNRFHLFVPCENGACYGFDQNGRPLAGWNGLKTAGTVSRPLVHCQNKGRDYLAVLTDDGLLSVYGRDGQLRFEPVQLEGSFRDMLWVDSAAAEPHFYAANTGGALYRCSLEGQVTRYQLGAAGSLILPGQLQGDGRFEWMNWEGRKLRTGGFSGENTVVYGNKMLEERPDRWFITPGQTIGAVDTRSKRIWMLDERGNLLPGFPLGGETPFVLLQENSYQWVVTAVNGEVWGYRRAL
ncbi:MAG: PQQ-binding-like beta-propeller repeat protein [Saprospiraceae bacterium]|nr:PQQ-binding-like beta-propeller repeat protein [Saprospiraceae bacterium]